MADTDTSSDNSAPRNPAIALIDTYLDSNLNYKNMANRVKLYIVKTLINGKILKFISEQPCDENNKLIPSTALSIWQKGKCHTSKHAFVPLSILYTNIVQDLFKASLDVAAAGKRRTISIQTLMEQNFELTCPYYNFLCLSKTFRHHQADYQKKIA
ncbi:MAG: hypothetical protein ACYCPT_08370, partial [Acidimicrobiales bacterium]